MTIMRCVACGRKLTEADEWTTVYTSFGAFRGPLGPKCASKRRPAPIKRLTFARGPRAKTGACAHAVDPRQLDWVALLVAAA